MPLRIRVGASHPKLLKAIELLEAESEDAFNRDALADRVGLSGRQLERLFRKHIGTTPRMYHLRHRLQRARRLLRQTSLPVIEVALACGFTTASHFAKSYRDQFGVTPSSDRSAQFDETFR
jgi:transcriptional regulator GlxA family with amidase domain